jgi:hypothetical protein
MKWMIGEKGKEWPKWVDDNVKPEISEALKNRDDFMSFCLKGVRG